MTNRHRENSPVKLVPNYGPIEAALFLHVPHDTLRYWISPESGPLIIPASTKPPLLSFMNLVECYVLDIIRRIHGITMPQVRFSVETLRALQKAKHLLKSDYPLAEHDLRTQGTKLFVYDLHGKIVNLTVGGQIEMPEVVESYLRRVVRDRSGVAERFFPLIRRHGPFYRLDQDPEFISVDPRVAFGKPVLVGSAITTDVIGGRLTAGDTEEELAKEYGRTIEEIRAAAEFEGVPVTA